MTTATAVTTYDNEYDDDEEEEEQLRSNTQFPLTTFLASASAAAVSFKFCERLVE